VDEIGPSLRFATATVVKATRTRPEDPVPPDDEWANGSAERPLATAPF